MNDASYYTDAFLAVLEPLDGPDSPLMVGAIAPSLPGGLWRVVASVADHRFVVDFHVDPQTDPDRNWTIARNVLTPAVFDRFVQRFGVLPQEIVRSFVRHHSSGHLGIIPSNGMWLLRNGVESRRSWHMRRMTASMKIF